MNCPHPSQSQSVPVGPDWCQLCVRAGQGWPCHAVLSRVCPMPCRAVPLPPSDAVLSTAGSVNSQALGAIFQRPRPRVLGRAELDRGQTGHCSTRTGTSVPIPPSPSRRSWSRFPHPSQDLGARGWVCTPGFGRGSGPEPRSYKNADSRSPERGCPAHAALPRRERPPVGIRAGVPGAVWGCVCRSRSVPQR